MLLDMRDFLAGLGLANLVAPLWFFLCWIGYAQYADRQRARRNTLAARVHEYRLAWMQQMLVRENRIVDVAIVRLLVQNISFFASGAVLIVGGLVAILGSGEKAMQVIRHIPFAEQVPPVVWDLKVLLLVLVFVYAFFKFTWSLRQFNYLAIVLGAVPQPGVSGAGSFSRRAAEVATRAGDHFNRGMRAYYFGLAALGWFVHPYLLILATAWVVLVVYRREFRSHMLGVLGRIGEPLISAEGDGPQPPQPSRDRPFSSSARR